METKSSQEFFFGKSCGLEDALSRHCSLGMGSLVPVVESSLGSLLKCLMPWGSHRGEMPLRTEGGTQPTPGGLRLHRRGIAAVGPTH